VPNLRIRQRRLTTLGEPAKVFQVIETKTLKESDKICYLIPSARISRLGNILTEQGREEALPAVFPTGSGIESADPGTATLIPYGSRASLALPPVLLGSLTPQNRHRVEHFYSSVYEIFQRWVNRPKSFHTRRSYRDGVLSFVRHRGIVWPQEASALLTVSVAEVQEYRDALATAGAAPKTINHRVSALCGYAKKVTSAAPSACITPQLRPSRNTSSGPASPAGRSSARAGIPTPRNWPRPRWNLARCG
jgi:hypothetical protein